MEYKFMNHNTLEQLITEERWEEAYDDLKNLIDSLSLSDIDTLAGNINESCKHWSQMLINTGLCWDDEGNGGYLSRKVFVKIWDGSTYHNKWILLKSLLTLYGILVDGYDGGQLARLLLKIQIHTGISPKEVLELFFYRHSNQGKIMSGMPICVQ